jgi:hypothetical protein
MTRIIRRIFLDSLKRTENKEKEMTLSFWRIFSLLSLAPSLGCGYLGGYELAASRLRVIKLK